MRKTDIVVGVDGSAASWDALYWAVREAYRWRADLQVVIVDATPGPATQRSNDDRLAQMVSDARRMEPSVRITGHSIRGGVTAALRETSNRSRMLVVGGRGTGGFGRLTLGSTGQQVATHATVPVVVRGCTVIAAFAYGSAEHPWLRRNSGVDPGLLHRSAYASLEAAVTPWQDKFPRVSVELLATAEQPVPVLVALSGYAQLVVVGAQGHDPSESIGSVPLRLMHRAHCPVMIAR